MFSRRLGALALSLGLLTGLCSCERIFEDVGHVSLSREGESVRVAFCDALEVDTILVTTAHRGWSAGAFVETVYIAKGKVSFPEGFVLSTQEETDGLDVNLRLDPRLDEANEVSVLASDRDSAPLVSVAFSLPSGGLPTDGWLQLDGSITEEAC